MSAMYDKIVGVISKDPSHRSDLDVQPLLPWFCKKSEIFGSMKKDVVTDIIINCQFRTSRRDDIIIQQGDKGDCFYILLRGTVSIFIKNTISDEEDESKIAEHNRMAAFYSEKGELDRSKVGHFIAVLGEGKSFGELALINKNCIRNASIVADESCDLLVVPRDLYNRSLRAAQAAEFEERNSFVREHPFFQNWAQKYKKQMAMSVRKETVQFEGNIVRQGEPSKALYFLLRGSAKVVVDPGHHPAQYPTLYPLIDPEDMVEKDDSDSDIIKHPPAKKKETPLQYDKPAALAPSVVRRRETRKKLYEVCLVGPNEVIGDVEFVLDLKTYLQTVECTQQCQAYALDTKNYERLITKRNPRTIDVLRHHAEVKLETRICHLHDNQIPLLRTLHYKMECTDRAQHPKLRKRDTRSSLHHHSNPYDVVPQQGALIDMFGPGTVFYRTKLREQMKLKRKSKQNFRGARGGGFPIAMAKLSQSTLAANLDNQNEAYGVTEGTGDINSGSPSARGSSESLARGSADEDGVVSGGEEDHLAAPGFTDFNSSDKELRVLEDRIKAWHTVMVGDSERISIPETVKLQRVNLDKGKEPMPGSKVVFKKKRQGSFVAGGNALSQSEDDEEEQMVSQRTVISGEKGHKAKNAKSIRQGDIVNAMGNESDPEALQAAVHGARISGIEEENDIGTAFDDLSRHFLTPSKLLQLHARTDRAWWTFSDCLHKRDGSSLIPESHGTILDIMRTRCTQFLAGSQRRTTNSRRSSHPRSPLVNYGGQRPQTSDIGSQLPPMIALSATSDETGALLVVPSGGRRLGTELTQLPHMRDSLKLGEYRCVSQSQCQGYGEKLPRLISLIYTGPLTPSNARTKIS